MADLPDHLTAIAPMLRVRPELQDFCRFGGHWRSPHAPMDTGWAAFHIVMKGNCWVERTAERSVRLETGDVLLLPHGDGHVVYGGGGAHEFRDVATIYRDHIRIKETTGTAIETELVCGRLYLENATENLLLRALPSAIVLNFGGAQKNASLMAMIRDELNLGRAGATAIASDLSSALFTMLLREHLENEPPVHGLLATLAARETGRAAAAMLKHPERRWDLNELAEIAAVSRATLVRAFRRMSGLPPQAFLTEIRLTLARNRIIHTSEPLAVIAAGVGYHSEAALSRAIQRRFAIRPGAIRSTTQLSTPGSL
ncbi:AraC family transcriptional regulator [Sphingomonas sp. UYP23]